MKSSIATKLCLVLVSLSPVRDRTIPLCPHLYDLVALTYDPVLGGHSGPVRLDSARLDSVRFVQVWSDYTVLCGYTGSTRLGSARNGSARFGLNTIVRTRELAATYANAHADMASRTRPGCRTGQDEGRAYNFGKQGGVTNGAAWYSLRGGECYRHNLTVYYLRKIWIRVFLTWVPINIISTLSK